VTQTQREVLVIVLAFAIGLLAMACAGPKRSDDARVDDRIGEFHVRDARTGRCLVLTAVGGLDQQWQARVDEDRFCEGPRK
jgi:hypothetical protein